MACSIYFFYILACLQKKCPSTVLRDSGAGSRNLDNTIFWGEGFLPAFELNTRA